MPEFVPTPGSGAATKPRAQVKRPRRYKVLLLNDDYTTMEFVVEVLTTIFRKSPDDAVRIMMSVHKNGMGVAGVYVKSIAEAKAEAVHERAREQGHPLRCALEQE